MNLPGTARSHVWTGLLIALVGVFVGGYAYTGERIYHIEYIGVAFFGFLLVVAGSVLSGIGQANRPRLGGNPNNQDDEPGLIERLKAKVASEEEPDPVSATLECADCGEVFDAEGTPPLDVECPNCGSADEVEVPELGA